MVVSMGRVPSCPQTPALLSGQYCGHGTPADARRNIQGYIIITITITTITITTITITITITRAHTGIRRANHHTLRMMVNYRATEAAFRAHVCWKHRSPNVCDVLDEYLMLSHACLRLH
jgi:hypothetical protein